MSTREMFIHNTVGAYHAHVLAQRYMLPSVISNILGMKKSQVQAIYRQEHGHSPRSGQHPQSLVAFFENDHHICLASQIARVYLLHGQEQASQRVVPLALAAAHDMCHIYCARSPHLKKLHERAGRKMELCYFVARDYLAKLFTLDSCRACSSVYISHRQKAPAQRGTDCPFCRVKLFRSVRTDTLTLPEAPQEHPPKPARPATPLIITTSTGKSPL